MTEDDAKAPTPAGRRRFVAGAAAGLLAVLASLLVLRNAAVHPPMNSYDGRHHAKYAQALAEGRLPGPEDSKEFFSAPLPYAAPAMAALAFPGYRESIGKAWQFSNVPVALAMLLLTAILVRRAVEPGPLGDWAPAAAVALLGTMPVFHKTFAYPRGEPLLAMLVVAATLATAALAARPGRRLWVWAAWGLLLGLLPLSRQWGFFAAGPLALVGTIAALRHLRPGPALGRVALAGVVAVATCGWFYLSLQTRFGSMTAFNRPANEAGLRSHPASFYLSWPLGRMARRPVFPDLAYRAGPILYSDFWGDYWAYFRVHGRTDDGEYINFRARDRWDQGRIEETNVDSEARYLGRVNVVSVVPTVLMLCGLAWAGLLGVRALPDLLRRPPPVDRPEATSVPLAAAGVVILSLAGYAWFVVNYGDERADVIKGSYVVQIAPMLVVLAVSMLASLSRRRPRLAAALLVLMLLAGLHNLPACFSTYTG